MKILVISDSHGETEDLRWLLEQIHNEYGPMDAFIHCGDGAADLERLRSWIMKKNAGASFYFVCGNCDFGADLPVSLKLDLEGVRIFVAHGHTYYVKTTLAELDAASRAEHCSVTLYGHTHIPNWEMRGTLMVNPGSVRNGRAALINIANGQAEAKLLEY